MPRVTRATGRAQEAQSPAAVSRESTNSWQIPSEDDLDAEGDQADDFDQDQPSEESPAPEGDPFVASDGERHPLSTMSAQQLLEPLQQTADRVSRQVEEFAKSLDKFNATRPPTNETLWKDAGKLLEKFKNIALERCKQATSSPKSSRTSSRSRQSLGDGKNEIQQVQLEADLWSLMASLISCSTPLAQKEASMSQQTAFEGLHRYSTNLDVWGAFISSDLFARECQDILEWLMHIAGSPSNPSIDDQIAEAAQKAQRGEGIWSAGWLFTKMAIKSQKRSRSWSKPLDPHIPGTKAGHLRRTDNRHLVTQLDPDARSREDGVPESPDEYHEKAAWQACWETLRRDMTLDQCRSYWSERKELWRAAAVCGVYPDHEKQNEFPWFRIINIASNLGWFETCKHLAQDGIMGDPYESAVYGLLSGTTTAPSRVCKTIDDSLFVHFNSLLIQRYHEFVLIHQQNIQDHTQTSYVTPSANYKVIQKYLTYAQTDDRTKLESRAPHKAIEAAILSKDFDKFFVRQGQALSQLSHPDGEYADLVLQDQDSAINESAQSTARNPDSLRMIVHLQLVLHALGYLHLAHEKYLETVENNITAYIGWLRSEGKFALVPLYASKLSPARAARTLGTVAQDIVDLGERNLQVSLMKQYGIPVPDVLDAQFQLANARSLSILMYEGASLKPISITQYVGPGKTRNIKVRKGFIGEKVDQEEEHAIRSLEWFGYTNKHRWGQACFAAASLYKLFIMNGRLSAAKELAVRAPLSDISLAALGVNLGGPDILGAEESDTDMDGLLPEDDHAQSISPTRRRQTKVEKHPLTFPGISPEVLAAKAQTWRELEQLVVAMDILEVWSDYAENCELARDSVAIRDEKILLKQSLGEVREAMVPILQQDYLAKPMDESEAGFLDQIRNHYLPELMLAYNSVLYFAGHFISRSWLVQCMELAQLIATTPTLTDAFVVSGRMQELVTAFALSSQALLRANEAGGKKSKNDKGVDIWQVKYDDGKEDATV